MADGRKTRTTKVVSDAVFREVYDSPQSLPGRHCWVTTDKDVRRIERRLGLEAGAIGAPLWVSGDTRACPSCGRETNWYDIVDSALARVHDPSVLVRVILGDKKYINTEAPSAIPDLQCAKCKASIKDLRSFKCHNWAYAKPELVAVLEQLERAR